MQTNSITPFRSPYHVTKNLFEASFLLAKGFPLTEKEESGGKVAFFFEGEGVSEASLQYYNRKALIDPKAFVDCLRDLKESIFER